MISVRTRPLPSVLIQLTTQSHEQPDFALFALRMREKYGDSHIQLQLPPATLCHPCRLSSF
jgi:hypothetical protein